MFGNEQCLGRWSQTGVFRVGGCSLQFLRSVHTQISIISLLMGLFDSAVALGSSELLG
jgi:hypothetical protein